MKSITEVVQNLLKPYIDRNIETATGVLGAKNLLPNKHIVSQTVNGLTVTVRDDGSIKITGTANAYTELYLIQGIDEFVFPQGKYIKTGCPSGGSSATFAFGGSSGQDTGDGVEFTSDGATRKTAMIYVKANYSCPSEGLIFKPMIRPASIQDDTYVPYAKTNRELTEDLDILEELPYDTTLGAINGYYTKVGHVVTVSFRIALAVAIVDGATTDIGKITKALPPSIPIYTNKQITWAARNSSRGGFIHGYATIDPNSASNGFIRAEAGTAQVGDVLYITFSYITS